MCFVRSNYESCEKAVFPHWFGFLQRPFVILRTYHLFKRIVFSCRTAKCKLFTSVLVANIFLQAMKIVCLHGISAVRPQILCISYYHPTCFTASSNLQTKQILTRRVNKWNASSKYQLIPDIIGPVNLFSFFIYIVNRPSDQSSNSQTNVLAFDPQYNKSNKMKN